MAIKEISGKDGSIRFTGSSGQVKSWTLSYVADALETSNFDDSSGGRTYIPGLTGWSGSFDCLYSSGNTAMPSSTGSLTMKMSTGLTMGWKGNIIITGMDITTPRDGLVTQSYTYQGTGTLSASTA